MSEPLKGPERRTAASKIDWVLLVTAAFAAAWILWGTGYFHSEITETIRTSSVYVEEGADVNAEKVRQVIGDRRLVAVYLGTELGDRGGEICDDAEGVIEGNLLVIIGTDLNTYGCALLPGRDDDDFGKAFVAESVISSGFSMLEGRPTETAKVMAVSYDRLVGAGIMPEDAREIKPPQAAWLIAFMTLGAVGLAAVGMHLAGRRVAGAASGLDDASRRSKGLYAERDAALGTLARRLIKLDASYQKGAETSLRSSAVKLFRSEYQQVTAAYLSLGRDAEGDSSDDELQGQLSRIEKLSNQVSDLEKIAP